MRRISMVLGCLCATWAGAQEADAGVEWVDAGPVIAAPPPPVVVAPVATLPPVPAPPPVPPTAAERVKGRFGFGFLGTAPVLQASEDAMVSPGFGGMPVPAPFVRVMVPIIGVRWWTPLPRFGVELGLGAMVSAPSSELPVMNGTDVQTGPTTTELLFDVSTPIVLASTEHTIIFLAPELRIGRSTKTSGGPQPALLAMTWNASLRAGVEVFFSFIGLPNLSLEAGVRAGFTHEVRAFTTTAPLTGPAREGSRSLSRFTTSLVANPWDLFTSTLAARYYF